MKFHRLLGTAAAALSCLLLASCDRSLARLVLLEANYLSAQGSQREAVAAYSRVSGRGLFDPYADYGLGVVYLSLGEIEPALGRFAAALDAADGGAGGSDRELVYRARYNAGLARYRSGQYALAADEFRRALEADGAKPAAKRNLELSLRALNRTSAPAASASPLGSRKAGPEPKALFDFIREKEGDRWKSREWKAASANTLDY
jgi:Ca-activated chloride channel family protein